MDKNALGRTYEDGEVIVQQGTEVSYMHVVQEGQVEILREIDTSNVRLVVLNEGDFFGSVPFFERRGEHSGKARATAKAVGEARSLTVDRKTIMRRIHEDPSLGYRMLELMSHRMDELENELARVVAEAMQEE